MISLTPYSDLATTLQASLALEAGRTLRWKTAEERGAIEEYIVTHWHLVERQLNSSWEPLAALHAEANGPWDREKQAESRRLMAKFDLRVTVMLQQIAVLLHAESKR
jgi:hypothetical protein